VDSEKLCWEKPKSHRTEKSGKTVIIISGKNCEKRISGMMVKCKNFCSAKYRMSNVKKISKVTLRKLLQWAFLSNNGSHTVCIKAMRGIYARKNYSVTITISSNLIVNLKIGLMDYDSEKWYKGKTKVSLNFRKIFDNSTLLKEQITKSGLWIKGTVAREARRRFLLDTREQKGTALREIFSWEHNSGIFCNK
jgi:hypothetical protein